MAVDVEVVREVHRSVARLLEPHDGSAGVECLGPVEAVEEIALDAASRLGLDLDRGDDRILEYALDSLRLVGWEGRWADVSDAFPHTDIANYTPCAWGHPAHEGEEVVQYLLRDDPKGGLTRIDRLSCTIWRSQRLDVEHALTHEGRGMTAEMALASMLPVYEVDLDRVLTDGTTLTYVSGTLRNGSMSVWCFMQDGNGRVTPLHAGYCSRLTLWGMDDANPAAERAVRLEMAREHRRSPRR